MRAITLSFFLRPSALSPLWPLVIQYGKIQCKLDNKIRNQQRSRRWWRRWRRMSKTRAIIIDDEVYNNKREDCMIRKEDTIYFDKLTVLLLLLLSFLLSIIIDCIYMCCFSISLCSFRRHCHDYSLVIILFLSCFVVIIVLIFSVALSFCLSSFFYSFYSYLYFKLLVWVIHFVR